MGAISPLRCHLERCCATWGEYLELGHKEHNSKSLFFTTRDSAGRGMVVLINWEGSLVESHRATCRREDQLAGHRRCDIPSPQKRASLSVLFLKCGDAELQPTRPSQQQKCAVDEGQGVGEEKICLKNVVCCFACTNSRNNKICKFHSFIVGYLVAVSEAPTKAVFRSQVSTVESEMIHNQIVRVSCPFFPLVPNEGFCIFTPLKRWYLPSDAQKSDLR